MSFKEWMDRIDDALGNECGLCHLDLADYAYRDAFDDGCTPNEIAWEVLQDNGLDQF